MYVYIYIYIYIIYISFQVFEFRINNEQFLGRSQWQSGIRRGSAAAYFWAQIPPEVLISVLCECCVLSGRGPCTGLITRP